MSDDVKIVLISSIASVLVAAAGLIVSIRNGRKVDDVHKTVNGKLSLLLTDSKAAGKQEEREEESERKDKKA